MEIIIKPYEKYDSGVTVANCMVLTFVSIIFIIVVVLPRRIRRKTPNGKVTLLVVGDTYSVLGSYFSVRIEESLDGNPGGSLKCVGGKCRMTVCADNAKT